MGERAVSLVTGLVQWVVADARTAQRHADAGTPLDVLCELMDHRSVRTTQFLCAGCGFYRPAPSYLSAIEQQYTNELGADRESALAIDAAEFVITCVTGQITAFEQVTDRMRRSLATFPTAERVEIEEAGTVVRRARAGAGSALLPLTVADNAPRDRP